jgi:hypothetical protein
MNTGPTLSDALAEIDRLREAVELANHQSHAAMTALAGGLKLLADQSVSFRADLRALENRIKALESAADGRAGRSTVR